MLITLHVIILIVTGLLVLYSDEQAALWFLGKKETLDAARIAFLHKAVSLGLAGMLITGGLLYSDAAPSYLSTPDFIVKMIAVAALILNTYFIGKGSHLAIARPYASLTRQERLPLLISGAVSSIGWLTAIVCGLLLGG